MKNPLLIILYVLIGLTLLTGLLRFFDLDIFGFVPLMIMGIAGLKFYLVAFEYMELRKAHRFWKVTVLGICLLVISIVGLTAR